MFIRQLFQSVLDLPGEFLDVALHDPLSAALMAVGGLLTLFSIAVFGLLVLGSIFDIFTPEPGTAPRRPEQ